MQQTGTPMDWFSSPQHDASIMAAWEHLVGGSEWHSADVRSVVDDSWQRCLVGHVDPGVDRAPPAVGEDQLVQWREANARLVSASLPLMQQTRELLSQTGTVMLLADPDGLVLQHEGDMRIIEPAREVGLVPGCNWTELNCGTNAIGTALALKQAVQIHGAEHFCAGIKRWTCSATVIRDPMDGRVLGVIDVSGLADTYNRYSLALTVSLAGRIESRLAKDAMERRLRLLDRCASGFGSHASDAILVVDDKGRLVKANSQVVPALRRLGFDVHLDASFVLPGLDAKADHPVSSNAPAWLRYAHVEALREGAALLGFIVVIPGTANVRGAIVLARKGERLHSAASAFERIVGDSRSLRAAVDKARQLAPSKVPVLLLGDTGVGKELFAQGIHQASERAEGPFVALNCGGLSRDLLASELFGYAEGAFTGARKSGAAGKIEAADGGTLFLDEIGEMPLDIQPHLLRVLQENEIYRLGENTPRKVNFRLVAATHRDLKSAIATGMFRMDLFYRIAVTTVSIPSLRERGEDLPTLIDYWLRHLCESYGLPAKSFDEQAYACLLNYAWPGNVRELRNAIEGALLLADGPTITADKLPAEVGVASSSTVHLVQREFPEQVVATGDSLKTAEAEYIRRALARCEGNLTQAAAQLGIAKSTLYEKLRRYDLVAAVSDVRRRGARGPSDL
ncbi:GAF modulated sigma54 specific transcriptional regulator, Fis family [Paraburkholderia ribeironis]|uniref:GAF modulated sigma54 specific transcriptional regulator, Fis family n=1 Tax=Paraburkholderia ribeironis TaxID=1247936 RepID=A0A1N7RIV5_9BURK|nr:sigma-54-dependent Fis family transcriptional regulator [Paraburkholderia ribeironis]SIT35046.1 GAF modulated sigma54 specific transcriptional regulator, Fis family [Paraburkholderia ribeironis]